MSELSRLQDHIANAFGSSATKGQEEPRRVSLTPPPLAADAAFETESQSPSTLPPRRFWLVSPYLFAGIGLLASALALAIGHSGGLYALAGVLGSVGAVAILMHVLSRSFGGASAFRAISHTAHSEAGPDEVWHRNESDAIHDSVHDALGDIVMTRDLDGKIVAANAVFRELVADDAPLGRTCDAYGIKFDASGQPGRFEVRLATSRGTRIFLWHDVMSRDAMTGRLVVQSLARDMTDERHLASVREQARQRAEEASEAKSGLLATVSHEIRTPLGGILGMVSLLSRTRLSPEQMNYLDGIRQSGEALGQLVDELLDGASIEAGRFSVNPVETRMRPFVEGVSEMLAHRAHGKGLEIAVTVGADVPERLVFDSSRVRQVLFNVIGNAVKFTRTGGVMISAARCEEDIVLSVIDTGPGMTEAELSSVFGEFEQAGEAAERSGGTGLGLAISERIMLALGGSLTAHSLKGQGSTFEIRFPMKACPEEVSGEPRSSRLACSRVLLLAPSGPAASATAKTLGALGATCLHATSGAEAAKMLECAALERPFTDIIVDHRLSASFTRAVPARRAHEAGPRRIFLVNPEERNARRRGDFDAWLIRPLREKSLTDVLTGRMSGVEKRSALNDNLPLPGFAPAVPVEKAVSGLTVLLAEDDPVNAMLARSTLEKAGHRVTHVSDFDAARAILEDSDAPRPDIFVTDLSMPGGDGVEIIAGLRDRERHYGLGRMPVLVLTADKRRQTIQRALSTGADGVLEKPAQPEILLERIALLCGKRQVHAPAG